MVRGNYQAWSHSGLNQITRAERRHTAARLGVVDERRRVEPSRRRSCTTASLYLINTDNSLQALDGASGELLWENRVGPAGQATPRRRDAQPRDLRGQDLSSRPPMRVWLALDARTGKTVWDTVIGDRARASATSSGPIVINGKVIQGTAAAATRYREETAASSARTTRRPAGSLWKFNTVAHHGDAGRRHVEQPAEHAARGRRHLDHRQLRPRRSISPIWGVAQAKPWMPASRGTTRHDAALYTSIDAGAQSRHGRSSCGTSSTCPANRSTSTRSTSACSSTSGAQKALVHDRQVGHPVEARSRDRRVRRLTKKPSSRTSSSDIDREDRAADVSRRHRGAADRRVGGRVSQHARAARTGRR